MQKGHTMQDVQNNPLGTEKISKLLLKFSVPTFVTLFINSLYNIVDQMFIGNKLGVNGISATNVAFPLLTLTSALALLIGDGCAANISLCLGKKEHDKANQYFGSALIMLIISGCLLAVLSSIFLEPLMYAFGADTRVMPYAMEYTRIILIGLPFSAVNIAFTTIIRADGNPAYNRHYNKHYIGSFIYFCIGHGNDRRSLSDYSGADNYCSAMLVIHPQAAALQII